MANAPTWTPDRPLRQDATNEEIAARFNMIRGNSESPLVYFNEHLGAVAREYAAACVAPAPAPHEDMVRLLAELDAIIGEHEQAVKARASLAETEVLLPFKGKDPITGKRVDYPGNPRHGEMHRSILAKQQKRLDDLRGIRAVLLAQPPVRSEEEPVAWAIVGSDGSIEPGDTARVESLAVGAANARNEMKISRWPLRPYTGAPLYLHPQPLSQEGPTRAEVEALRDFAQEFADEPCFFGDNCPTFGSRHGRCNNCKARNVLALFPKVTP